MISLFKMRISDYFFKIIFSLHKTLKTIRRKAFSGYHSTKNSAPLTLFKKTPFIRCPFQMGNVDCKCYRSDLVSEHFYNQF